MQSVLLPQVVGKYGFAKHDAVKNGVYGVFAVAHTYVLFVKRGPLCRVYHYAGVLAEVRGQHQRLLRGSAGDPCVDQAVQRSQLLFVGAARVQCQAQLFACDVEFVISKRWLLHSM